MHTPHSLTHPHSLYPTNYTSLTFIQTHSQSSFKAHSSHIHTLTLSPHSAHSSHIHTQTHSYFNAHSSHILTHAHTLNLHLMHTTLTLTHLHSLCPTNYNPLTITHTHSQYSFNIHSHSPSLNLSHNQTHSLPLIHYSIYTHLNSILLTLWLSLACYPQTPGGSPADTKPYTQSVIYSLWYTLWYCDILHEWQNQVNLEWPFCHCNSHR